MKRLRVLLVDDEPVTGQALHGWLTRLGHEPLFAAGPQEADRALATHTFDVVLSDVQMPGNFELEWIEHCLRSECPPPILLMTGSPELETAMRAANLPIAGYLLKPLDYEKAAALLERLGEAQRRRVDLAALAQDLARLAAADRGGDSVLREQLQHLARQLVAETHRSPRAVSVPDATEPWRQAIAETIAVLEKTKHSFRSKELGALRRRLEPLLPATSRAEPEPASARRVACG